MSGPTWTEVVKKIAVFLAANRGPRGGTSNFSLSLWKICHSAWMCMSLCCVHVFKGKLGSLSRSLSCFPLFYCKMIRHEFSLYTLHFHAVWLGISPVISYTWISPVLLFYTVQVLLPLGCHYCITIQLFFPDYPF
jgi:hypothetical protein